MAHNGYNNYGNNKALNCSGSNKNNHNKNYKYYTNITAYKP